jgi:hypothetical protein
MAESQPLSDAELSDVIDAVTKNQFRIWRHLGDQRQLTELVLEILDGVHRPYDTTDGDQRCFTCASTEAYPNGAAVHEPWPCLTRRTLEAFRGNKGRLGIGVAKGDRLSRLAYETDDY